MKHIDRKAQRKAEQERRNKRTERAKAKQDLANAHREVWA